MRVEHVQTVLREICSFVAILPRASMIRGTEQDEKRHEQLDSQLVLLPICSFTSSTHCSSAKLGTDCSSVVQRQASVALSRSTPFLTLPAFPKQIPPLPTKWH